jgi:membrane protease YdiL (CAAX protease family)
MAETQRHPNGFAMAVVVEGGLAVAAVILAWVFGVQLREQIPQSAPQVAAAVARGVLVTLPMLAAFYWLVRSSMKAAQDLRQLVEWLISQMFPTANTAQFAMVAVLAGVGEELLFRGVIQTLLTEWTSPIVGLALCSLLFGLAHALSKLYFVLAMLIGFCFGGLVLRYDDLLAPIVAHSLYDFVALVYLSARMRPTGSNAPTE